MNKNGLQVLENIYAAQRLILMTGADIRRFLTAKCESPSSRIQEQHLAALGAQSPAFSQGDSIECQLSHFFLACDQQHLETAFRSMLQAQLAFGFSRSHHSSF